MMCFQMPLVPQAVRRHAAMSMYQHPLWLSVRSLVQLEVPPPRPASLNQRVVSDQALAHWLAMRRHAAASMHHLPLWLSARPLVQMKLPPRRPASLNQLAVSGQALPHWRTRSPPSCDIT
jgi:hypothetical protein